MNARHATILLATMALVLALVPAGTAQGGQITWEGHGSEHIEGCETGFHWIFSPGGGVSNVLLHTEVNGTPQAPIPMEQMGASGQGAWHADTGLVDTIEGETPWVTFTGSAHQSAALRISNCLDEEPGNGLPPPPPPEVCVGPQWITGEALDNPPRNALEWDSFPNATGYNLYRATEGGDFSLLAQTNTTSYTDEDVVPFTTYQYRVTAQLGDAESDHCDMVEITAIPFFPTVVGAALAAVAGLGAYAVVRRRR